MNRKTISINNKIIGYNIAGMGHAVILLHGFGEDSQVWAQQVHFLKNSYQVIAPDIPGSGASDLTDDVSMEAIAHVVKEIADAEALDTFTLIGHSMGGYATLAFAEKYPARLNGFGLFHSTALPDSSEKIATRKKGIAFIQKHGAMQFLDTVIPNLFSPDTQNNHPQIIKEFTDSLPDFSKTALIAYYEAMIERPDRTAVLKNSKHPVLFILGEKDTVIPLQNVMQQTTMPSIVYINILKKSGHMGMLEEPDTSNQALLEFLSEIHS